MQKNGKANSCPLYLTLAPPQFFFCFLDRRDESPENYCHTPGVVVVVVVVVVVRRQKI